MKTTVLMYHLTRLALTSSCGNVTDLVVTKSSYTLQQT